MKLQEFLNIAGSSSAEFARKFNLDLPCVRRIINEDGAISLDNALQIENSTAGLVTVWDMSPNAEMIRKGQWNELRDKKRSVRKKTGRKPKSEVIAQEKDSDNIP